MFLCVYMLFICVCLLFICFYMLLYGFILPCHGMPRYATSRRAHARMSPCVKAFVFFSTSLRFASAGVHTWVCEPNYLPLDR